MPNLSGSNLKAYWRQLERKEGKKGVRLWRGINASVAAVTRRRNAEARRQRQEAMAREQAAAAAAAQQTRPAGRFANLRNRIRALFRRR